MVRGGPVTRCRIRATESAPSFSAKENMRAREPPRKTDVSATCKKSWNEMGAVQMVAGKDERGSATQQIAPSTNAYLSAMCAHSVMARHRHESFVEVAGKILGRLARH